MEFEDGLAEDLEGAVGLFGLHAIDHLVDDLDCSGCLSPDFFQPLFDSAFEDELVERLDCVFLHFDCFFVGQFEVLVGFHLEEDSRFACELRFVAVFGDAFLEDVLGERQVVGTPLVELCRGERGAARLELEVAVDELLELEAEGVAFFADLDGV